MTMETSLKSNLHQNTIFIPEIEHEYAWQMVGIVY